MPKVSDITLKPQPSRLPEQPATDGLPLADRLHVSGLPIRIFREQGKTGLNVEVQRGLSRKRSEMELLPMPVENSTSSRVLPFTWGNFNTRLGRAGSLFVLVLDRRGRFIGSLLSVPNRRLRLK